MPQPVIWVVALAEHLRSVPKGRDKVKRFHCTICKKVVRVRRWPYKLEGTNLAPKQRVGECNWHDLGRATVYQLILKEQPKSNRIKLVKGTTVQQSKKGGR